MPTATARKQETKNETNSLVEEPHFAVEPFLGEKQRSLLRKGMCANLSDDQADYFYEVVERTRLDPFEGLIWPSIRYSKAEEGEKRPNLIVMVKLQGLRVIGDRSGLCDGEDPVEWTAEDGIWKPEWLLKEPPVAARARVYRKDRSRPQTVVCRWDAYVQTVWDKQGREIPNAIWKRLGSHMLGKCALAGCYRGLFPNQASGVYISEEIGEVIDPNSEEAIEAEMARRAMREAAYWEAEKAKGHYPAGQRPPEVAPAQAKELLADPGFAQRLPEEPATQAITRTMDKPVGPDPRLDWRTFPISRIRIFAGRPVGSLTASELRGLTPWLQKVESQWGSVDNDIKAHFTAITQRIENDNSREQPGLSLDDELNNLDLSPQP